MESSDKFSSSKEVIEFLAERFPNCFSIKGEAKPLKIGIFQDIVAQIEDEPRLSKTLLRSSLRHYTSNWRYLQCIQEGVARVDLAGNEDDKIEKEHAEHAAEQLKQSKEKAAERRKQREPNTKKNDSNTRKRKTFSPRTGTNTGDKRTKPPVPAKLTTDDLKPGTQVTVKLGKMPMKAVITELTKDGVQVQLDSGMIVKVEANKLRLAPSKR